MAVRAFSPVSSCRLFRHTSRWRQVTVFISELNDSFNRFKTNKWVIEPVFQPICQEHWFIQEQTEWVIESVTQPIHSRTLIHSLLCVCRKHDSWFSVASFVTIFAAGVKINKNTWPYLSKMLVSQYYCLVAFAQSIWWPVLCNISPCLVSTVCL